MRRPVRSAQATVLRIALRVRPAAPRTEVGGEYAGPSSRGLAGRDELVEIDPAPPEGERRLAELLGRP